jgi:CBS domain-containing protein
MTTNVVTLCENDSIEKAAQMMNEHGIGSLPVCKNGKVVGMITDRDIATRSVANGKDGNTKVCEVMSKSIVTGTCEMSVDEASKMMSNNQVRRLPIVENKSLVGIVALGDMAVRSQCQDEAEDALNDISKPCEPMV